MNLTRRTALKGFVAASFLPLLPACVFAASAENGGVSTSASDGGWLFLKGDRAGAHEAYGRAILLFDGVYRNAELWINGKEVGKHPYGYTAFYFDITDLLNEKGGSALALKVSNTGKNSRWYSGSGIDRHVVMMTSGRVSIPV